MVGQKRKFEDVSVDIPVGLCGMGLPLREKD